MSATIKKGRPTKQDQRITRLEKDCEELQKMLDGAQEFAQLTQMDKNPEFNMRLKLVQLDLDSKKLFVGFLKATQKEL